MNKLSITAKTIIINVFFFALVCQSNAQSGPIVSAFFGLDNAMPFQANFLCPGALGMDGMPVNFLYPIDASSLSASDFEVVDGSGNIYVPMCAVLAPANENGENRTVLLIGEFGNDGTNPPVEVRVVDDLFTIEVLSGESSCSEIMNLNGVSSTNIVELLQGPSMFFAQKLEGNLSECGNSTQTIQVAWNGGITPYLSGDTESDLFLYYVGYTLDSGALVPHVPISIADINDNDNFHQLCFSTNDEIVKISMIANSVEDPNLDPNLYSEVDVTYCTSVDVKEHSFGGEFRIFPNPFESEIFIENLNGGEHFILRDYSGRTVLEGKCSYNIKLPEVKSGLYLLSVLSGGERITYKLIKD